MPGRHAELGARERALSPSPAGEHASWGGPHAQPHVHPFLGGQLVVRAASPPAMGGGVPASDDQLPPSPPEWRQLLFPGRARRRLSRVAPPPPPRPVLLTPREVPDRVPPSLLLWGKERTSTFMPI